MASAEQITGTTLDYDAIPDIIRSPLLKGATLSFTTFDSEDMDLNHHSTVIRTTNSEEGNLYKNHIFVSYTALTDERVKLLDDDAGIHVFNVMIDGEYIYYDNGIIKSTPNLNTIPDGKADYYKWVLGGNDPYAMSIRNLGYDKYLKVTSWAEGDFLWVDPESTTPSYVIPSTASRFIIKSSQIEGTYEVMAPTGITSIIRKNAEDEDISVVDVANSVDASLIYYNIGRSDDTTVKMFSNATYQTGNAELRFELTAVDAHNVTYHLIDKYKQELLTVVGRHAEHDVPQLPSQYVSPLVETYYYYKLSAFTVTDGIYELNSGDLSSHTVLQIGDGEESDDTKDIYVLYDANNLVDMNHTTMYLLKYEQGDMFRQEDGSDGLLDDPSSFTGSDAEKKAIYQAVYPYCNGDGNFFVYGENQYELQQEGAASTRTRWAWYVQSSEDSFPTDRDIRWPGAQRLLCYTKI